MAYKLQFQSIACGVAVSPGLTLGQMKGLYTLPYLRLESPAMVRLR